MFQSVSRGVVAALVLATLTSGSFAAEQTPEHNKLCESVFTKNQASIEKMIGAGDIAGVQSVFVRANCPELARLMTIKCKVTILPPAIICTFAR